MRTTFVLVAALAAAAILAPTAVADDCQEMPAMQEIPCEAQHAVDGWQGWLNGMIDWAQERVGDITKP